MEAIIRNIIESINPFDEFDAKTDLLGEGVLDSLSLMVLIEEIEKKFKLSIPEEKVNMENFYSIDTIIKLLEELK